MMDTALTDERIRESTRNGWWRNETLETHLDRWASVRPRKTAVLDAQRRYTWAELARAVERVAFGLAASGVLHARPSNGLPRAGA